jgi:flagellar protein FliL
MAKIIMLLNLVIVLGSAGLVYYSHNIIKRQPTDQEAELAQMLEIASGNIKITPVKMKKLTINLYSRKTRLRYLDLELNILTFIEKQKAFIKNNETIIADAIIEIAGDMTPKDLNSVSGKILLETRIRNHINDLFQKKVIKEIFFSRFVIQ